MTTVTFKGTTNVYTVVATTSEVDWGVNVAVTPTQEFLIRFACLGVTKAPPKHFNFRMMGEFTADNEDEVKTGIYFDRGHFKVVPSWVSWAEFSEICSVMDIPAILGEWVARQFAKEGVSVEPTKVETLCMNAFLPKLKDKVTPCFKMPKDIFHELTIHDSASPTKKSGE